MIRKRNCLSCNKEMEYKATRGMDRKYCGRSCQQKARSELLKTQTESLANCKTADCGGKANRIGAGLCEACYARLRRKGTTNKKTYPYKTLNQAGYTRLKEPSHPLADSGGTVYEHRFVYHKYFGDGPFDCHWCGLKVTWYDLNIDHLDCDITNNDISNLVATCPPCNTGRGKDKSAATCRANGVQLTHNGETMCISEWAKRIGITFASLKSRLISGWTIEKALTEPKGVTGPKIRPA